MDERLFCNNDFSFLLAFFLMVQHTVTPTKLFPAPQGNTMTPDLQTKSILHGIGY
jgi:hypothetical protein